MSEYEEAVLSLLKTGCVTDYEAHALAEQMRKILEIRLTDGKDIVHSLINILSICNNREEL